MVRMVEVVAGRGHLCEIAADWTAFTVPAFVVPTCEGEGGGGTEVRIQPSQQRVV